MVVKITFNISGICYVPGATYSGDLGIDLVAFHDWDYGLTDNFI